MELHQKLDALLNFFNTKFETEKISAFIPNKGYDSLDFGEVELRPHEFRDLLTELQNEGFVKLQWVSAGVDVLIKERGIQFVREGGYTGRVQQRISEQEEAERKRKQDDEVAAAAIKQAEEAEKANRLAAEANEIARDARDIAWLAFAASLVALGVSIFG